MDVAIVKDGKFLGVSVVHESLLSLNPDFVDLGTNEVYVGESFTCVVDAKGAAHPTMSPVSEVYTKGLVPDGKGGWVLPPPTPAPDATSVLNWQLSAALAAKGVSFSPADATIAARWQYEPSFAIDGAVATALKASLGYDASQLQALFNEAAALK